MKVVLFILFALQASFCEEDWYTVGHKNEFRCVGELGKGSFGEVLLAEDTSVNPPKSVAVKFESVDARPQTVPHEVTMYTALKDIYSIPKVYYNATADGYNIMVMDLVGDSFEKIQRNSKDKKFSHKSIALFAIQALERLEDIHENGIVHRDLKPENFAMDLTGRVVTLIDFGIAYFYRDPKTKQLKIPSSDPGGCGSPRYMSRSAYKYKNQGRNNDLESLGYILKGFANDWFPWDELHKLNDRNYLIESYKLKQTLNFKKFCKGLPSMYYEYLKYVRELNFYMIPDYDYLKGLFRSHLTDNHLPEDYIFDWTTEEQAKLPIPVKPNLKIQPPPSNVGTKIDNPAALPPPPTNIPADTARAKLPTLSTEQASLQPLEGAQHLVTGSANQAELQKLPTGQASRQSLKGVQRSATGSKIQTELQKLSTGQASQQPPNRVQSSATGSKIQAKLSTLPTGQTSLQLPKTAKRPETRSVAQDIKTMPLQLQRPILPQSVKTTENSIQTTAGSVRKSISKTISGSLCSAIKALVKKAVSMCADE